eukprot:5028026-Pleurochrysis_carterae.AAC.4
MKNEREGKRESKDVGCKSATKDTTHIKITQQRDRRAEASRVISNAKRYGTEKTPIAKRGASVSRAVTSSCVCTALAACRPPPRRRISAANEASAASRSVWLMHPPSKGGSTPACTAVGLCGCDGAC